MGGPLFWGCLVISVIIAARNVWAAIMIERDVHKGKDPDEARLYYKKWRHNPEEKAGYNGTEVPVNEDN